MEKKSVNYDRKMCVSSKYGYCQKKSEFINHAVQSIKSIKIVMIISPPNKFTQESWGYSPCMWIVKCH